MGPCCVEPPNRIGGLRCRGKFRAGDGRLTLDFVAVEIAAILGRDDPFWLYTIPAAHRAAWIAWYRVRSAPADTGRGSRRGSRGRRGRSHDRLSPRIQATPAGADYWLGGE